MKKFLFLFYLLFLNSLEASLFHHLSPITEEWREENVNPFDELFLSWNASRPANGKFLFYVSLKTEEWSPWLLYASWGSDGQSGYLTTADEVPVRVYQDAVEVLKGKKATGFQIKILPEKDASLDTIYGLHVYTNSDTAQKMNATYNSIYLKVPSVSQITVNHPRNKDLCSPTSTTAVVRYLLNDNSLDPAIVAKNVWDSGFDIFGNWVFNVAVASTHLGPDWNCFVARLNGFDSIYQHLNQGNPVIISVRGPLKGSALPYAKGHLMVVIGYDALDHKIICMDPAFPNDDETHVSYDFSELIQAWDRRGNIAYIFTKKY